MDLIILMILGAAFFCSWALREYKQTVLNWENASKNDKATAVYAIFAAFGTTIGLGLMLINDFL